ncbi:MAG: CBS domain-containing protein [Proteobacteria bacterium]|nr:CBS domain-containing protein [Pseudomonadota bacterium]
MSISEVMTREVRVASPEDTLQNVAGVMEDEDFGSLPVAENDRLVGMLTDRDIAIRAVARGLRPQDSKVREIMSMDVQYVYIDDSVQDVARIMGDLHVRRLPVLDRERRLVGIVSLGDLARSKPTSAGDALQSIADAPSD